MSLIPFLAPVLGPLLFINAPVSESIFFSYLVIFLGSFIMYPIGSWYYGILGDKKGRRLSCISSSLGLCLSTGLVAFLPTFWFPEYSWIFFTALIAAQFFFSAGEYNSSIIYSLEHGPITQYGLMSGLSCFFSVLGLIFANSSLFFLAAFPNFYSWRIPFLIGLFTGFFSFFLKNFCKESPFFEKKYISHETLDFSFIKKNFLTILNITIMSGLFYVLYGYIFLFLPLIHHSPSIAETDTLWCLLVYGLALLLTGCMSVRYGITKMMLIGIVFTIICLIGIIVAYKFFLYNDLYSRISLTFFAALFIGPIHGWTLQQVSPHKRCRLIGLGTSLASAVFFNSTVPLSLYIYEKTSSFILTIPYLFLFLLLCLFIILFNKHRSTAK